MKLLLLGTTGYHPNDQRQTACLMLPESGTVFDAGTAMYRVRRHLRTDTLDVFLTHAHLDHVIGLTFLFDVLWQKKMKRVAVYAEPEKREAVEQHLFAEPLFPVRPDFEWRDLRGNQTLSDGGILKHFPVDHPGGAVGYRVDWPNKSLAYVTDTTARPNAPYVSQIQNVDLLVHECNFPDGWEDRAELTGHSCASSVARVAARAGVKRLVLVHINPLEDECAPFDLTTMRSIFPNTSIGQDNTEIEF